MPYKAGGGVFDDPVPGAAPLGGKGASFELDMIRDIKFLVANDREVPNGEVRRAVLSERGRSAGRWTNKERPRAREAATTVGRRAEKDRAEPASILLELLGVARVLRLLLLVTLN